MVDTGKSTYWSLTINNPTDADEEAINLARQKGWKITGQKEQGKLGTIHYQLCLYTPGQVRQSAVKKAFPRAHIEFAKNPKALQNYVQKEETRIGQLQEEDDKYPSLSKLWDLIYDIYQNKFVLYAEGFDYKEAYIRKAWNKCELWFFDEAIRKLIRQGYHVESMAVNPQVRACWKSYHLALMERCARKQQNNSSNSSITNGDDTESIQTAEIPTTSETQDYCEEME